MAEVPDWEGGTTTAVDKVIQHYAKEWGSGWQARPGGEERSQDVWPDDTEVPDMQMEDIRRAALSVKSRTSCPCGLHPKHVGMVSNELLDLIARQWTIWKDTDRYRDTKDN